MDHLKSIYNIPFKDSYSHPIRTCFGIIASNEESESGSVTNLVLTATGGPAQTD